ncbi:ASCH domain-containing protein [Prauserella rugosa]|uniref:ASCH domain-containing protein n=1 Tax=Prauserella rugosa TaxID=43354 RepID=A0A660CG71_9PSEU|nr:ASCH domain-containing protein [Prauserella rugosa]KMS85416.1 CMP deaminase [Streptomyces regensis]TWH21414.1 ASCH domain-containing protein [Prauserella rugosa]
MLSPDNRELVAAAVRHAEAVNDDADHTVAAALRLRSGAIVLGVNAYHFLGGPCGEVSALANRAASHPDDPIVAVAAAHGPTGDVIPPCGKCRQIFFDLDPTIACVVREANGLTALPVSTLLPHAFDWRAADAPQRLYMWEGYEQSIRDGDKTQTIRIDDPFRPGPADLVFEKESGEVLTMPAEVLSVRTTTRRELTETDAQRDGFADLAQLHTALDQHYPGLGDDAPVDVVEFALTRDSAGTHRR